jgi:hypothetical protein
MKPDNQALEFNGLIFKDFLGIFISLNLKFNQSIKLFKE